jgi:hypothetical protein
MQSSRVVLCACADTLAFFGFCEICEGSGKFARQKRGFWEIQNNSQNPGPKKSRTQKMAPMQTLLWLLFNNISINIMMCWSATKLPWRPLPYWVHCKYQDNKTKPSKYIRNSTITINFNLFVFGTLCSCFLNGSKFFESEIWNGLKPNETLNLSIERSSFPNFEMLFHYHLVSVFPLRGLL